MPPLVDCRKRHAAVVHEQVRSVIPVALADRACGNLLGDGFDVVVVPGFVRMCDKRAKQSDDAGDQQRFHGVSLIGEALQRMQERSPTCATGYTCAGPGATRHRSVRSACAIVRSRIASRCCVDNSLNFRRNCAAGRCVCAQSACSWIALRRAAIGAWPALRKLEMIAGSGEPASQLYRSCRHGCRRDDCWA